MKTLTLLFLVLALASNAVGAAQKLPRFERTTCPFDGADGRDDVQCGYLVVPENRDYPDRRTLRLAVAVLKSLSEAPEPDPIVFIAGGPGGPSVQFSMARLDSPFWTRFRKRRDIVFFDQRGAGYSEPHFCESMEFAVYTSTFRGLSAIDRQRLVVEAVESCRDAMLDHGIDFSTYNSSTIAQDLADLREALDFASWNLLGVSYGTRVALEAMRAKQESIRSVILDSAWPMNAPLADDKERLMRSLELAFSECTANEECEAAFPTLAQDFLAMLDDFKANPMILEMGDADRFPDGRLVVDGNLLAFGIFQGFYSKDFIPVFPLLVREIGARNRSVLTALADALAQEPSGSGLQYSVDCYEWITRVTPEMIDIDSSRHAELSVWQPYAERREICEAWHDRRAMESEYQAVYSDIPTLILAGEFDPITPPAYGQLALANLARGAYIEVPGAGHGASPYNDCTQGILESFLANPSSQPEVGCIAEIAPVKFTTDVYLNPGIYKLSKTVQSKPAPAYLAGLGLMLLLMLSALTVWPVAWLVRRLRKRKVSAPQGTRAARLLAAFTSLMALGFLIGLGVVIAGTLDSNPFLLGFGAPGDASPLFLVPWLVVPAAIGVVIFGRRAWSERWWSLAGRIHYLLVALACVGFVIWTVSMDLM
jgi:pimeloyl-ACP methyl ester carboxylesterase